MLSYILYALLIWFLYNLIFRFIIPIYRTTRQVKQKFSEMQQNMQDEMKKQQDFSERESSPKPTPKKAEGDYIDFEEIK